jgi:hypothetical protein
MTKSKTKPKKQFADQQPQGASDNFSRALEMAFADHPWPADRAQLLEHAGRQGTFAKSDLARLKRIPHREYTSVADLMDATRHAEASMGQSAGPVASAEHNRRAMGDASPDRQAHSESRFAGSDGSMH